MSDQIKTNVVSLPPGNNKDKLPAHVMLKLCKRLELLSRRHKNMDLNERRSMFLTRYEDLRMFSEKNPFLFYAFTEDDISAQRRGVYKRMIQIRMDIESGKMSENDGNGLMGDLCRANP